MKDNTKTTVEDVKQDPALMETEELATFVISAFAKIADHVPYIEELKSRFDAAPRGVGNRLLKPIAGCYTWNDFCETRLGRSRKTIFDVLQKSEEPRQPKPQKHVLDCLLIALEKFSNKSNLLVASVVQGILAGDFDRDVLNQVVNMLNTIEDTAFAYRQELTSARKNYRLAERMHEGVYLPMTEPSGAPATALLS